MFGTQFEWKTLTPFRLAVTLLLQNPMRIIIIPTTIDPDQHRVRLGKHGTTKFS